MAESTEISWTDHTLNLWWGCAKVHAGCDHCYAEAFAHRYGHEIWGPKAPRKASKSAFRDVLKFQKKAAADGVVRRVFVGSMMDIFEKPFPLIDSKGNALPETTGHLRTRFFEEVVPQCPNLLFLLLTKRPGNILKYIPEDWKDTPPANVMYGTSVVDQATADDMIPKLLEVPGRRFLSMEPLIGPVSFRWAKWIDRTERKPEWHLEGLWGIDWVIVGGESGHGARPMRPQWAKDIRDQCAETETPFHFKQWGEWIEHCQAIEMFNAQSRSLPIMARLGYRSMQLEGETLWRFGKHEAGNLLDGKLYQDVPTIERFHPVNP
jgi:protein gp37